MRDGMGMMRMDRMRGDELYRRVIGGMKGRYVRDKIESILFICFSLSWFVGRVKQKEAGETYKYMLRA